MKPEPMSVVFSVPLAVDNAVGSIVEALNSEGFAVVSKLDIHPRSESPLVGEIHRATLLRACYPKEKCARYFMSHRDPLIVRCSILLQQNDQGSTVEVARPTRLLDLEREEIRTFIAEADRKLRKMVSRIMKDLEETNLSRDQRRPSPWPAA